MTPNPISSLNPLKLLRLLRYRFFLFAGMLPFLLGQAIAFRLEGSFDWGLFWWSFAGIFAVLAAVEFFNEYFDAKYGGDRIFSPEPIRVPKSFYPLGIAALGFAFVVGLNLALRLGWPVMAFSFCGFLGAYFYVGTPIRWAYRGFGELVIALCYGPLMVLGSYYVQTGRLAFVPFFASLICGLSIFCLAVLNEIPDYYQDMLVGKWNLVVRLGKPAAMVLLKVALAVQFLLLFCGVMLRTIPLPAIVAAVPIPWIIRSLAIAQKNYDNPRAFLSAVNTIVVSHLVVALGLGMGFLKG